jgi:ABC-type polysaccharide/polyol phosphate export permease
MVRRDLKVRYKKSLLGFAWAMLSPLLTMAILSILFSEVFGASLEGRFPLYVISGLLPWTLFSSATAGSLGSITSGGGIIRRVYVPKGVFPVAALGSSFVTFLLSLAPLLLFMGITRAPFTLNLLLAVVPIIEIAIFALGVSMLLATLHVFFRDVKWFYDSALVAGFYATPIFYTEETVGGKYAALLEINPLWPMLRAFRDPIIAGAAPDGRDLLIGALAAVISLGVGWAVLKRYEDELINYL